MQSFRPLSGNYISQLNRATLTGFVTEFPSPVGELHFSIEKDYDDPEAYECKVSVPCRGTTFLNGGKKFTKSEYTVSVPCRGTTFLNMEMKSPVFLCRSFRPLSGNYISQSSRKEINYEKIYYYVSVPCRGTTFLNDNFGTEAVTVYCFRPLSGNYISQLLVFYQ